MMMTRMLGLVIIALAALTTACGSNGEQAAAPSPGGSAEAYCQAVEELNERAEAIFADVNQEDPEESEQAQTELYSAAQEIGYIDAAPEEIREDVATFINGVYGPDDDTYDEAEVEAAEKRVLAYEEEHCEESDR